MLETFITKTTFSGEHTKNLFSLFNIVITGFNLFNPSVFEIVICHGYNHQVHCHRLWIGSKKYLLPTYFVFVYLWSHQLLVMQAFLKGDGKLTKKFKEKSDEKHEGVKNKPWVEK